MTRLDARRSPQLGWYRLEDIDDPLLEASGLRTAYYANGFAARPDGRSCVRAWSTHEHNRFPATVHRGACVGVQFHPERSSVPGLRFLEAFLGAVTAPVPIPLVPSS